MPTLKQNLTWLRQNVDNIPGIVTSQVGQLRRAVETNIGDIETAAVSITDRALELIAAIEAQLALADTPPSEPAPDSEGDEGETPPDDAPDENPPSNPPPSPEAPPSETPPSVPSPTVPPQPAPSGFQRPIFNGVTYNATPADWREKINAAQNGDTVVLQGNFTPQTVGRNSFGGVKGVIDCFVENHIRIDCTLAVFDYAGVMVNKGVFVTRNRAQSDWIEIFGGTFRNIRAPGGDFNGAPLRKQDGSGVLVSATIDNCDQGVLSAGVRGVGGTTMAILGGSTQDVGHGGLSHGFYIKDHYGRVEGTKMRFDPATAKVKAIGHFCKFLCDKFEVLNADIGNPEATMSGCVEQALGGIGIILDSDLAQGINSDSKSIITYGGQRKDTTYRAPDPWGLMVENNNITNHRNIDQAGQRQAFAIWINALQGHGLTVDFTANNVVNNSPFPLYEQGWGRGDFRGQVF